MSSRVTSRPRAKWDLVEQAYYFAEENPDLADRFLSAAELAFERLAELPLLGKARDFEAPRLTGLRMWPIPGFERHLIFYLPMPGGIEVVRVLHSARDLAAIFSAEEDR